jgi:hypothetical protein
VISVLQPYRGRRRGPRLNNRLSREWGRGVGQLEVDSAARGELGRTRDIDLSRGIRFPYVHDLGALLGIATRHGIPVPEEIEAADRLTDYAVLTRYPLPDAVTEDEHREATMLARLVVDWAGSEIAR